MIAKIKELVAGIIEVAPIIPEGSPKGVGVGGYTRLALSPMMLIKRVQEIVALLDLIPEPVVPPTPCNKDIFKDGKCVAMYSAGMIVMEGLVREANRKKGIEMDWHYAGGIAVVLTLGDTEACRKALADVMPMRMQ
jgi:hypothetical protein